MLLTLIGVCGRLTRLIVLYCGVVMVWWDVEITEYSLAQTDREFSR